MSTQRMGTQRMSTRRILAEPSSQPIPIIRIRISRRHRARHAGRPVTGGESHDHAGHPSRLPALIAVLAAAVLALAALPATAENVVPPNWSLKPSQVAAGNSFRLMFISTTKFKGESSDIGVYNGRVQNTVRTTGHRDIQVHAGQFKAVVSTDTDDARGNTATTYTAANRGVPIYWLGGVAGDSVGHDRIADNYADFYDGSWDSVNHRTEDGARRDLNATVILFTGSEDDGTAAPGPSGTSLALGNANVAIAKPSLGNNTLSAFQSGTRVAHPNSNFEHLYALSPVFTVAAAGIPYVSTVQVTSDPGADDTYTAGDTIAVTVTFSSGVAVTGTPQLTLDMDTADRAAAYDSAQSTATALVFTYTLTAGDRRHPRLHGPDQRAAAQRRHDHEERRCHGGCRARAQRA